MAVMTDPRAEMVERQLAARGITDESVLRAMREVPREEFLPETISQPYIMAPMAQALEVRPGERVLEIGAGSGYAAAVLSRIAGEVSTVERHASLAQLVTLQLDLDPPRLALVERRCLTRRGREARTRGARGWRCPREPPACDRVPARDGLAAPRSGRPKARRSSSLARSSTARRSPLRFRPARFT